MGATVSTTVVLDHSISTEGWLCEFHDSRREQVVINPGLLLSFSEPIAVNLETTLPDVL